MGPSEQCAHRYACAGDDCEACALEACAPPPLATHLYSDAYAVAGGLWRCGDPPPRVGEVSAASGCAVSTAEGLCLACDAGFFKHIADGNATCIPEVACAEEDARSGCALCTAEGCVQCDVGFAASPGFPLACRPALTTVLASVTVTCPTLAERGLTPASVARIGEGAFHGVHATSMGNNSATIQVMEDRVRGPLEFS